MVHEQTRKVYSKAYTEAVGHLASKPVKLVEFGFGLAT